jgi:hypothetical protein
MKKPEAKKSRETVPLTFHKKHLKFSGNFPAAFFLLILEKRMLSGWLLAYDLEKLARLRNPARLQLGPERHVVQGDLEGPRRNQLQAERFFSRFTMKYGSTEKSSKNQCCGSEVIISF